MSQGFKRSSGSQFIPTLRASLRLLYRAGLLAHSLANVSGSDPSRDWTTYAFDTQRTGYNPKELNSTLGPKTVGSLHQLWAADLGSFSNSYANAQPVYAHSVNVNGKTADILYVGTHNGVFHAIDAISGKEIWSRQLGTAFATSCGSFPVGINGSAVLDRGKFYQDRVYVADGQNNVYALSLVDGSILWGPINLGSPEHLHIWGGLTASGGNLYIPVASYCDDNPYQGGLFEISKIGTKRAFLFQKFLPTQPSGPLAQGYNGHGFGQGGVSSGGIWGVGGASIDPSSLNVYVGVGNANSNDDLYGYGDQLVNLSTYLTPIASNFPVVGIYPYDSDFGGTPVLFDAPSTGCSKSLLAATNKSGSVYVYDRNNIQNGILQEVPAGSPSSGFITVPAFSPVNNYLYVSSPRANYPHYTNGIIAFSINSDCTLNTTPAWQAQLHPYGNPNDDPYSSPTVANGVVYITDGSGGNGMSGESNLFAFDAQTGSPLWSVGNLSFAYVPPTVVDGRVYIVSDGNKLYAFGL